MKIKKVIALMISSLVITSSVLGCSKSLTTDSKTGPAGNAAQATGTAEGKAAGSEYAGLKLPLSDKKITLTMYAGTMDTNLSTVAKDYNENAFFKELEKRTNVHIEFQTVPQGSTDAFNLMIASGELQDLIMAPSSYQEGLDAGVDDGIYLDLTPYLDTYLSDYNKLRSQSPEIKKNTVTDAGRVVSLYQIYTEKQQPFMGLMMRKDWLDECGLEVPKTVSQWEKVLTAFKEKEGAYAPLEVCGNLGFYGQGFNVASNVFVGNYLNKNGKVVYNDTTDDMKAFLTVMADWYKKGLIDPDFMTKQNSFFADSAMVTSGQTGVFLTMYTLADMYKAMSKDPDFELVAVQAPIPDSGEPGKIGLPSVDLGGMGMAVSASCKEKEIAMQWLDYLFTKEGTLLANYGIEGDTFKYNDEGKPLFTERITKNPDGLSMAQAMALYTLPPSMLPCAYDWTRELSAVSKPSIDMMSVWGEESTEYNYPSQATMTSDENRE